VVFYTITAKKRVLITRISNCVMNFRTADGPRDVLSQRLTALQVDPGEPVPEETFTHSHPDLWLLYNIFNELSPFSKVHRIFFGYLFSLIIFFYDLTTSLLWPASTGLTHSTSKSMRFSPYHSHPFLKCVHTILTHVAVSL